MTGAITLKSMCFLNLNLEANSAAEMDLLKEFTDDAKEVGRLVYSYFSKMKKMIFQNQWLLSDSSKTIKDIGLRFREERNTLKTQVCSVYTYC